MNPAGRAMPQNQITRSKADMGPTPSTFARIQPRTRGRPSGVQLLYPPGALQSSVVESSKAKRHQISSTNSPSSGSLQHANSAPVGPLQLANNDLVRGRSDDSNELDPLEEMNNQSDRNNLDEAFENEDKDFAETNEGLGVEFAEEEQQARNQYLEHQALRAQADWAHNSQDGTRIYAEPQKEYKTVEEARSEINTGLPDSQTRKINGEIVLLERRNKAGDIVFRHPDYANLANDVSTNILGHHSIKVYMNALVHLYFWQTVDVTDQNSRNPNPYPRGLSIKSFLLKHKEDHERHKATSSDDAGLDDMALQIDDAKWMELAMRMLKSKKLVEVATLWLDKQAFGRHQLARDWCVKDMFLYTLQEESVTKGPVEILIGWSKVSKTNHYKRAEHFGFFRSKNVL
ncbi:hypothetical protein HDU77_011111, partial [Chytriomyces hyalinus]